MAHYRSIFVTGAGGFVGRHFCAALADRFPAANRTYLRHQADAELPGWRAVAGDLLDPHSVAEAIGQALPDLVVHLAAQASVAAGDSHPETTWSVNAGGTLSLAKALRATSPNAAVFYTSSAEVYGGSFNGGVCDEASAPTPISAYARSKLAGEQILADCCRGPLIIVRPFNHTGPGQDTRFALPAFARQIAEIEAGRRDPVVRVGDLSARRDFLDVRDVVAAYMKLLERPTVPHRELFVVCRGETAPIRAMLDRMRQLTRAPFEIREDPALARSSTIPEAAGCPDRLAAETAWAPQVSLDGLVAGLLDYWRGRSHSSI